MYVGDRARLLVSRGINPLAEADLSVSAKFHNTVLARTLRRARASFFVLGCCATTILGSALHLRQVTPVEITELTALSRAGVDADHLLPDDLPLRLAVPRSDVVSVAAILSSDAQVEPDMSWVAGINGHPGAPVVPPSRVEALREIVVYLSSLTPQSWPAILTSFRIAGSLDATAWGFLNALRQVPSAELPQLPQLIQAIMALPPDRREALERAGFPTVPTDPARQDLYALEGRASAEQDAFVAWFLRERDQQKALPRVSALLKGRSARRFFGALTDGVYGIPDLPSLPAGCDVGRPGSCRGAR